VSEDEGLYKSKYRRDENPDYVMTTLGPRPRQPNRCGKCRQPLRTAVLVQHDGKWVGPCCSNKGDAALLEELSKDAPDPVVPTWEGKSMTLEQALFTPPRRVNGLLRQG
jgi:hypothetical protein